MKIRIILPCLMILFILVYCTEQKKSPMEGAWQVVSWQQFSGDSVLWTFPGTFTGGEMKVWSKNHFAFAGRYKKDTTFIDNCGGGTYKLEGTHYEESILYFLHNQPAVGTTIKMLLEVKNDTLIVTWPVDEKWQVVKGKYSVQKSTRLEK
jgi:hypothetical protein